MVTMIQNWRGAVEVNGTVYDSIEAASDAFKSFSGEWHIRLLPAVVKANTAQKSDGFRRSAVAEQKPEADVHEDEVRITVKAYMTRTSEPGFDFMQKWNNDNPMPLRTMVGYTIKETRGMRYMKLHGMGLAEVCCMRCGRRLTHPVSRHYGIGPECMTKLGIVADIDDVDAIKEKLEKVEWTGWVIKSAIIDEEEV